MSGNVLVLLLLITVFGCATPPAIVPVVPVQKTVKDTVVLVQDTDGTVGRVTVATRGGTRELTAPNTVVEVMGSEEGPAEPRAIAQTRVDELFADSSRALPPEPVSFLLYFLHDSKVLSPESNAQIAKIVSLVDQRGFCEISIIGHTDTTGTDEYNMKLSSARAGIVREALLSQGIRPAQVELRYHGKRDPLVPTRDNVKEPRNRRVEVVVK